MQVLHLALQARQVWYIAQLVFFCSVIRNIRTMYEICSKLTKSKEWRHSGVFINNKDTRMYLNIFEHISHIALVFILLNLNKSVPAETKCDQKSGNGKI